MAFVPKLVIQLNKNISLMEDTAAAASDGKVKVDAAATSDYLGATSADGALRTGALLTYVDGGNFVTLNVNEASIDHDNLTNTHNLTTSIDHDTITNGHNLTSDIDHDQLTNYLASEHFTVSSIDHGSMNAASLLDDDHTQYFLADGSRAATGSFNMGTNSISNVATVAAQNFVASSNITVAGTLSGGTGAGDDLVLESTQNATKGDIRFSDLAGDAGLLKVDSGGNLFSVNPTRGSLVYGDSGPDWSELVVGTDGEVLLTDGIDAFWAIPGVTSVVTVAKGGTADYNTIQAAVNYIITQTPSTSNRFVINIYRGTYVEDVDLTGCPYTNLNGMSRNSNDVTIQTVNGTALTFDNSFTPAFIANIQLQCKTPTSTTGICVEGYGIHIFDNCLLDVGGSTAGAYARYAVFTNGVIQFNSCRFQSSITGTSAGANSYALAEMTGTAFAMNNTSSLVTCNDVDDNITFFKLNSVGNRVSMVGCLLDYRQSNASHSGDFKMFEFKLGASQSVYISGSDLNLQGAGGTGTATMFDVDFTTNDGYVVVTGCNCETVGFGTNYVAQVATGDELEIVGCHVEAADAWTGAGTVNFASLLNDTYVLSPVNNVNEGNQAWGTAPINPNHQISYTEVYTSTNKDGIYFYPIWTPASSETGSRASIAGYSILGASSNWGAGASLSGLNFGTWTQGTSGGSANLDLNAVSVFGHGGLGVGTVTAKEVCGLRTQPTGFMQPTLNCDAIYGIKVEDCFNALSGTQTNHYSAWIGKPTQGTNQYCLWLDGTGAGSGVWFGTTTDRIYNDATDLVLESTNDVNFNGNINFTSAGVATGFTQLVVDNISFNGNTVQTTSGPLNLAPNTTIEAGTNLEFSADNRKIIMGASNDAEIYYTGVNLLIDPKAVGGGAVNVAGDLIVDDTIAIGTTASTTKYLNMEKTSIATSGNVYAIWNNHTVTPSASSTGDFFGIGGFCSIQNTNFGVGSSCTGLNFQNFCTNITAGSVNLDCIGINTVGIGSFQSIVTVKSAIGLQVQSLSDSFGSTMTCTTATGLRIVAASNETITTAYGMLVDKEVGGATNYQAVFNGTGAGSGLWLGGTSGARIFCSGTDYLQMNHTRLGFFSTTPVVRPGAYTITNGVTDRTYNANGTSTAELADVLYTLITDLQNYGLLQ